MANIRWKLITILVVLVVFAGVGVYPILAARRGIQSPTWLMDKQLKLGLDLKGGVHLELRVQTDDALRLETEQEMERLRETLTQRGIMVANLTAPDPTHFRVEGVPPAQDAAFRDAAADVQVNFDRGSATSACRCRSPIRFASRSRERQSAGIRARSRSSSPWGLPKTRSSTAGAVGNSSICRACAGNSSRLSPS